MNPTTVIADRFVLERPAGAGGMGTVYRAIDRTSGTPVALKIASAGDDSLLAEARAEIMAIAARIGDDGLRASFLTRGLFTAKLLQLAEAEGVHDHKPCADDPAGVDTS